MLATGTKTSATRGLQFSNPSLDGLTAGSPFNLTWSGASGTTTLTLQNGTADNMDVVATIACMHPNYPRTFMWKGKGC